MTIVTIIVTTFVTTLRL